MIYCKHVVQQRITTSEQKVLSSHTATVRDGVLKSGYTSAVFVDMGAKVDGTYYCDFASVTTVVACYMSCLLESLYFRKQCRSI